MQIREQKQHSVDTQREHDPCEHGHARQQDQVYQEGFGKNKKREHRDDAAVPFFNVVRKLLAPVTRLPFGPPE